MKHKIVHNHRKHFFHNCDFELYPLTFVPDLGCHIIRRYRSSIKLEGQTQTHTHSHTKNITFPHVWAVATVLSVPLLLA